MKEHRINRFLRVSGAIGLCLVVFLAVVNFIEIFLKKRGYIVKFFEERNIDIAVFEKQYWEYRNKGEIHSEEDKSINQVKRIKV